MAQPVSLAAGANGADSGGRRLFGGLGGHLHHLGPGGQTATLLKAGPTPGTSPLEQSGQHHDELNAVCPDFFSENARVIAQNARKNAQA